MFWVDFVDLFFSVVFPDYVSPFNNCCKADLVVLNSLNFCLSEKLFISPSILNEIFAWYSNLGCSFFYYILLFRSYFHHFIFQLTDSFFCFRYSAIDSFWSIFDFSNCVVCLYVYSLILLGLC